MNELMNPIHDSIPGYREARENLEALNAVPMPTTTGANTPAEQLAAEVMSKLAEDKPLNLLAGAATAMAEVGAVEVARGALTLAREQLRLRIAQLKTSNRDLILSGLNSALAELVDEVRTFQPLSEVTSEAGAIASDRTKDYKRLQSISRMYPAIRHEQLRIMRDENGGVLDAVEALFCRNLPDLFPLWAPWRTHGYLVQQAQHDSRAGRHIIRPPWPVPDGRDMDGRSYSRFHQDASGSSFLFWALEVGAELWVPTPEDHATHARELRVLLTSESRDDTIEEQWRDPGAPSLTSTRRSQPAVR